MTIWQPVTNRGETVLTRYLKRKGAGSVMKADMSGSQAFLGHYMASYSNKREHMCSFTLI